MTLLMQPPSLAGRAAVAERFPPNLLNKQCLALALAVAVHCMRKQELTLPTAVCLPGGSWTWQMLSSGALLTYGARLQASTASA